MKKLEARLNEVEKRLAESEKSNSLSIVVFSGEWDKLFAAYTLANGALAMGMEVHMFFTFWGATALRCAGAAVPSENLTVLQRLFSRLLPRSASKAPLSRMNLLGLGRYCVRSIAKTKGVDDLPTLIQDAEDLGLKIHCCETSLHLFGWACSDLRKGDTVNLCGVTSFLAESLQSKTTLFI